MARRRKKRSIRRRTAPRTFTVTRRYIESRTPFVAGEWVPLLRLSGHWLEQCGLGKGARVSVIAEQGRLVVTLCEQAPAMAAGDVQETPPLYESLGSRAVERSAFPAAAAAAPLPAGLRPPSGPLASSSRRIKANRAGGASNRQPPASTRARRQRARNSPA